MKQILIFAPHPDDEIIGTGGSIANHILAGNKVSVVYLTSGESGDAKISKQDLKTIRQKEAKDGAKILGVTDLTFLDMPDGGVAYTPQNVLLIAGVIRTNKPNTIYLPHKNDAHPDHQAAYRIINDGIWRAGASAYQELPGKPWQVFTILTYEVWTPMTKFAYTEDISAVINQKISALKAHTSQLANKSYDEAVKGFNRYRGAMTGKGTYVECFGVEKITNL